MKCKKKYNEGGVITGTPSRKATKKDKRKGNTSPHGLYAKDESVEDSKKPNVVDRNSTLRRLKSKVFKRRGKKKGRRTSESCRNPNF